MDKSKMQEILEKFKIYCGRVKGQIYQKWFGGKVEGAPGAAGICLGGALSLRKKRSLTKLERTSLSEGVF